MIGSALRAVRAAGLGVLLAAAGCATLDPLRENRNSAGAEVRECAAWYEALDAAVDKMGVRDAQATRVKGFAYLRVDRFSASLRGAAQADEAAFHALVDRLLVLDLEARGHEIPNLPAQALAKLWIGLGEPESAASVRRTRECGRILRDSDMAGPQARGALLERLAVPDDYITGLRVAGLYELAKIPFSAGVRRHLDETESAFRREYDPGTRGLLVRYSPPNRPKLKRGQVGEILARAALNPLRVRDPLGEDLETLFAAFAPSFEVETSGDYDRPGALRWLHGPLPEVEAADPAVYRQVAQTRYRGVNLLQLVYTVWFPERPPATALDPLAGKLDGVVFRVTLAPDGSPLVYDTMHPCGCYHMFFTTPRAVPVPAPEGELEWAFVPQALGEIGEDDRLVVRIASRTHYVERVFRDQTDSLARYDLRTYDELRSLPRMTGGTRSVFGPEGFIAGTNRSEQWLFWPMGIANAGAMRQWGRHATAFVGRRHFDDADLLERRFALDLR